MLFPDQSASQNQGEFQSKTKPKIVYIQHHIFLHVKLWPKSEALKPIHLDILHQRSSKPQWNQDIHS